MLKTIYFYEWKQMIRSKGLIIALLVFTGIGIFCLEQGNTIYKYQITSLDSAIIKKNRNYHSLKATFDTLDQSNTKKSSIEEPFFLEWKLQDVVVNKISPLCILSIGQSDIYTPVISGHFYTNIFKNNYTEFKNPEQLFAGNLDLAFFIVYLFPLLLLAITYNVQSSDKEKGITPLLNIQANSLKKVLWYRILVRWLISLIPILITGIISLFLLSSLNGFSIKDFLQWWFIAFLYTIFWLIIVLFIQGLQFNSLINAISLAGLWILWLVAIPGLLNTWFNYQYPAVNTTEITAFRDFTSKAWEKSKEEHSKYLFAIYPELLKDSSKLDTNNIKSYSSLIQIINKEKELQNTIANNSKSQMISEEKCFWINPIGGVMRSFTTISNTSLEQQLQFELSTINYRQNKLKYIFENNLLKPHFTKSDLANLPKYNIAKTEIRFAKYLIPIFFIIVLLTVLTFLNLKSRKNKKE